LFAGAIGVTSKHETGAFSVDAVLRALDRKVAGRLRKIDNCDAIYAYEDGALQSFRAARDLGLKRIYDLPIGYWRVGQRIFAEEKEREPEWASTLTGTLDSAEKLGRKDDELRLATRVIVASTFTKQTLGDAPSTAKIDIVAYGAPPPISDVIRKSTGGLKVLFAGPLCQRKGLSYVLDAVEKLKGAVELTLLGRKAASGCAPLESAVRKHRWLPTLSHAGVLREMQSHDVLVLPSLFEGFGLVILEAMAQGTPVITTDHTAGPDVIENGTDGFIVLVRSAEEKAKHRVRQLIWLYFWLLLIEGALRKWVMPRYSNPLLLVRDPVLLVIYFYTLRAHVFPRNAFVILLWTIGILSLIASVASLYPYLPFTTLLEVTLYGFRCNFLHLPLIFIMACFFG